MVELLIATATGLIVLGGLVIVLSSLLRSQPEAADRAFAIQDARVKMERVVRELRQGEPVESALATESQLTVVTYVRDGCGGTVAAAAPCQVTYTCSETSSAEAACTRRVGTASPTVVVTGLSRSDVFSYAPSASTSPSCSTSSSDEPGFVCIRFEFSAEAGEDAITLEDGFFLRNATT